MAVKIDCWDKNIFSIYDSQNQLIDRTRESDSSEIAKADLTPYNFLANLIVTQIANFGRNMRSLKHNGICFVSCVHCSAIA